MSYFDIGQGGVDSRPGGRRVPELVQTDGPGFSLCAAPLESSGPGFHDMEQRFGNERRSSGIPDRRCWRGHESEGKRQGCQINQRRA